MPSPFMACYAATKQAIEGLFGCLREEFIMSNNQISITLCTLSFVSKWTQAYLIVSIDYIRYWLYFLV